MKETQQIANALQNAFEELTDAQAALLARVLHDSVNDHIEETRHDYGNFGVGSIKAALETLKHGSEAAEE